MVAIFWRTRGKRKGKKKEIVCSRFRLTMYIVLAWGRPPKKKKKGGSRLRCSLGGDYRRFASLQRKGPGDFRLIIRSNYIKFTWYSNRWPKKKRKEGIIVENLLGLECGITASPSLLDGKKGKREGGVILSHLSTSNIKEKCITPRRLGTLNTIQ